MECLRGLNERYETPDGNGGNQPVREERRGGPGSGCKPGEAAMR